MRLNRDRPFAEVFGMAPVVYQQGGHYFLRNGELADAEPAEVVEAVVDDIRQGAEPPPPPVAKVAADDMRLAANKALKVQMESYGETWQGVAHAKKFLGIV